MTNSPLFRVALVCGLIFLVFVVSVLINGFSAAQLAVLLVPLALYTLALLSFGEGSVIEMGFAVLIVAVNIAILIPVFHRWQDRRNHPHPTSKNVSKPTS